MVMAETVEEKCEEKQSASTSLLAEESKEMVAKGSDAHDSIDAAGVADLQITFEKPRTVDRATWGGKIEFVLSCVSYAVGLGNVWRFPYLCHKNGGGAFLLPYVIMLILVGLPLFFLEFAFGQFASLGPISIWSVSPLFKGIGYAMVAVSWLLSVYYNVIIAEGILYMLYSFTGILPWTTCGNDWNDNITCLDFTRNSTPLTNSSHLPNITYTSPAEDFYYNFVLQKSAGIDQIGLPSWQLSMCLLFAWVLTALVLLKGVQSLGKVSYFTALFPYVILTILLVRSLMLKGSLKGILYYITPRFNQLKNPGVWVDAATQIFFSLGCCSGSLIAMSSYNPFKNNCCRDAIIVACINCCTSIYAGFVIFACLGFMAETKNTTMENVARSGPGLAFVVYPEALAQMPFPSIWSVFFFFMLSTVGLGSQFAVVETVMSGVEDELRRLGILTGIWMKYTFRISLCVVNFLLGIPMVCRGGYYLLYLIDWAMSGYPLMIICVTEIGVICYSYGLDQFRKDIELMTNTRPNWYWRVSWLVTTPGISIGLIIFSLASGSGPQLDNYVFPKWAETMGYLTAAFPVICIPVWLFYKYCKEGGWILFKEFLKPINEWGPAQDEYRAEFISMIRSSESIRQAGVARAGDCGQVYLSSAHIHSDIIGDLEEAEHCEGPRKTVLGLTYGSVVRGGNGEGGFFQSKLNVAEKLTMVHNREVAKRSGVDLSHLDTEALTASQIALAMMTAAKEVQPYSVTYDVGSGQHRRISDVDALTINFHSKDPASSSVVPLASEQTTSLSTSARPDNQSTQTTCTVPSALKEKPTDSPC